MRDFGYRLHHDPESIPEHERSTLGGPFQKLIDHPLVVSLLNEFTAHPSVTSSECYGYTVESTNLFYRTPGMVDLDHTTETDYFVFQAMHTATTLSPAKDIVRTLVLCGS